MVILFPFVCALLSQQPVFAVPATNGIADSAFMGYITSSLTTLFPAYIRLNQQDPSTPTDSPVNISFSGVNASVNKFSVIGLSNAQIAGIPGDVSLKERKFSAFISVINQGLFGQEIEFALVNDYTANGKFEFNNETYEVKSEGQTSVYLDSPMITFFVVDYSNISINSYGRVDVSEATLDAYYEAFIPPVMPLDPWLYNITGLSASPVEAHVRDQLLTRVEDVRQGKDNPVAQLIHRFISKLLLGTPSFNSIDKIDNNLYTTMKALNIPAEEVSLTDMN